MRRVLIILIVGAACLLLAERFGPGGVQRRGLRAAHEFRKQLEPSIASDPRFAKVELSVMTHPSLRVYGEVPDGKAEDDLKALCQAPPNAPFFVSVRVDRADEPATRPAD